MLPWQERLLTFGGLLLGLLQRIAGLLDHVFGDRDFAALSVDNKAAYRHWRGFWRILWLAVHGVSPHRLARFYEC